MGLSPTAMPTKGMTMNLRTRSAAGVTAAAMASIFGLTGTPANAAPSVPSTGAAVQQVATTLAVTGTLQGRAFTGQMSNLAASVAAGTATLSGSIKGTGLPAAGTMFTTEIESVTVEAPVPPAPVPVAPVPPVPAPLPTVSIPAQPECTILAVSVSDLRLNLLGLVILIPELQLIAGGVTGPDALLGNVLCNLAGGAGSGPAAAPAPAAPVVPVPQAIPAMPAMPAPAAVR